MIMLSTQRIISLVPSLTELLFELGLDKEVVGRTKFCVHPADLVNKIPIVGGTKTIHHDRIEALQPTLILANKEENTKSDVETLQTRFNVLLTNVVTMSDALNMIMTVGKAVDRITEAWQLTAKISESLAGLPPLPGPKRAAYLIWQDPWMVAGNQTFIDTMLAVAGFSNVFGHQSRYPVVSPADLQAVKPDLIFLSSEPYPFRETHKAPLQALCPNAQIRLVDGAVFSWYGSRLLQAADYFKTVIRPAFA